MKTLHALLLSATLCAKLSGGFSQEEKAKVTDAQTATEMVHSENPQFMNRKQSPPSPEMIADMGFEQPNKAESVFFYMQDGTKLHASKFEKESGNIVLLLHGVLSSSYTYNKTAGYLRETMDAGVYALDFRGHGRSGGTPGDVDVDDQYALDLCEVIQELKSKSPTRKIIIAGHSMGGGIALRFAMLKKKPEVDGYIFFAPHLGHDAPTLLSKSPEEHADTKEPFLKLHLERIAGIKALKAHGIHKYDSWPVLFFNLPEGVPLRTYSYRSNFSMAPREYKKALDAVNKPAIIVAGDRDEAFNAHRYADCVSKHAIFETALIPNATHNGIRHSNQAYAEIGSWASRNGLIK